MKKFIFASLLLVGTALQAHASDCTAAYQDILYKEANAIAASQPKMKVVRVGPIPLELAQDQLNRATTRLSKAYGREFQYRRVDVARAMLRVQDPSKVEVIILEWTGLVYRPTNLNIRGYQGILVNKSDCKAISDTFAYDNFSIGERSDLPADDRRGDW